MQNANIAKIVLGSLSILVVILIVLYCLKIKSPMVLNKHEAIKLCQEVVYTKVDKNLAQIFKSASYKKNNNEITIGINFLNGKYSGKHKSATTAQCVFVAQYNKNSYIKLKSFFYQDISKNIYIYYNTLIKVNLIK